MRKKRIYLTKEQRERLQMEIRDMYKNMYFSAQEIANIYGVSKPLVRKYVAMSPKIEKKLWVSGLHSELKKKLRILIFRDKVDTSDIPTLAKTLECNYATVSKLLISITGDRRKRPIMGSSVRADLITMYSDGIHTSVIYDKYRHLGWGRGTISVYVRAAKYITGELTIYYDEVTEAYIKGETVTDIGIRLGITKYKAFAVIYAYLYKTTGLSEESVKELYKGKGRGKKKNK